MRNENKREKIVNKRKKRKICLTRSNIGVKHCSLLFGAEISRFLDTGMEIGNDVGTRGSFEHD